MKRFVLKSSFFVYLLIGLEILIMISPFAAYFYSFYSPVLNLLNASRFTRWLTEFFLPHFVFFDDLIMKAIGAIQLAAFFGGMLLFLYAAVPLYYRKFTRRGVATRGIYERIRHPQYLGLGIAGFGLLLYWPRFFILLIYLTMLFVYYLLARNEEQRMISSYPDSYRTYMAEVPMFLPGEPGGKLFRSLFGSRGFRGKSRAALYGITVLLSLAAALLVRQYSVHALKLEQINGVSAISVLPGDDADVGKIVQSLLSVEEVRARIQKEKVTHAYLMPSDFFLMALVTDIERLYPPGFEKPALGNTIKRFFQIFLTYTKMQLGIYSEAHLLKRIIFVCVRDEQGCPVKGKEGFRLGVKRYAAFHVDMDTGSGKILSIQDVKPGHKWGRAPMPVF